MQNAKDCIGAGADFGACVCSCVQQAVGGKEQLRVAPILAGRKARDSIDGYLMSAG